MSRFSIIGTAGRSNAPVEKMTHELYQKMIAAAIEAINTCGVNPVILVTGGAAWSDHVAVDLFLNRDKYPLLKTQILGLELHLPAKFNLDTSRYHDTGSRDWRTNPGHTSNFYHEKFSATLGQPDGSKDRSFQELNQAIRNGAKVTVYNG